MEVSHTRILLGSGFVGVGGCVRAVSGAGSLIDHHAGIRRRLSTTRNSSSTTPSGYVTLRDLILTEDAL